MIKFQQQFNEIKLYYYFKHSSNKIPNSKRKSIQSFFTFDLRARNNRTELSFSTKSQSRSRNSIYPIYIYIHVLIIRSKTDPTSLNRRRKRISDGQRSDAKQLGQEKTPRGFPGGWKDGPRKNLRIFANACPHWILFVVRKHGPRDGFIVPNAAGSPATCIPTVCVNKWYV